MNRTVAKAKEVVVGDRVRFHPARGTGRHWWTVQAADDRYLVATSTLLFGRGSCYTVVDRVGFLDKTYNGEGNGVVRSSLNTLGGGWDPLDRAGCEEILAGLRLGEWEFSLRRIFRVDEIEVAP
jgi:hypothetical protein